MKCFVVVVGVVVVFVFSRLLVLSCLVKLNVLFWLHLFKV